MQLPHEAALNYPLGDALPAPGTTIEIAPGVRWLRMALPFALDHINLWLLRDVQDGVQGWTIVDCGVDNADTRARWERIFDTELEGLPVLRAVVTHMHPDHIGLAHWLTQRWSRPGHECRLWISATDWYAARVASSGMGGGTGGERSAAFYARHGLADTEALAQVRARSSYYAGLVPQVPARYRRLMDGMALGIGAPQNRPWRCIAGYGHAPEHISLHSSDLRLLISGDMLLPRISTNVSVVEIEPEANPLPLYLDSIAALRALPAETLVLPSHGKPFRGLHTRIDQLHTHHEARYADVVEACVNEPHSAAELLQVLFKRKLDLHQTTFAMGEAVAHLHALAAAGRLEATLGADGVQRFRTVR